MQTFSERCWLRSILFTVSPVFRRHLRHAQDARAVRRRRNNPPLKRAGCIFVAMGPRIAFCQGYALIWKAGGCIGWRCTRRTREASQRNMDRNLLTQDAVVRRCRHVRRGKPCFEAIPPGIIDRIQEDAVSVATSGRAHPEADLGLLSTVSSSATPSCRSVTKVAIPIPRGTPRAGLRRSDGGDRRRVTVLPVEDAVVAAYHALAYDPKQLHAMATTRRLPKEAASTDPCTTLHDKLAVD